MLKMHTNHHRLSSFHISQVLAVIVSLAALLLPVHPSQSFAAEPTIIRESDGVMYVSTSVEPDNAIHTATTSASPSAKTVRHTFSRHTNFSLSNLTLPEGFYTDVAVLINQLLRFVFLIAALLTFLQLILAGFNWITAGGDRGKVDQARSRIIAAILGLIIVSASYAVLTILLQFLGFSSLNDVFSTLPRQ